MFFLFYLCTASLIFIKIECKIEKIECADGDSSAEPLSSDEENFQIQVLQEIKRYDKLGLLKDSDVITTEYVALRLAIEEKINVTKFLKKKFNNDLKKLKDDLKHQQEINDNLTRTCSKLRKQLEIAKKDAAPTELILLFRYKIDVFERGYLFNLPKGDEFEREMLRLYQVKPEELKGEVHFRNWVWMVYDLKCNQMENIRKLLSHHKKTYLWFARQIQILCDVFKHHFIDGDYVSIKYISRRKIHDYSRFLTNDLRIAVNVFMDSELVLNE